MLGGDGVTIHSKGQATKIVVSNHDITIDSKGDVAFCAEQVKGTANEVMVSVKDYIWMYSGSKGVLLSKLNFVELSGRIAA